jgi:hypothetical protein
MDDDTLTTAARAVAEMAQAFTAEVDRLNARIRELEAELGTMAKCEQEAVDDNRRLRARIRDLEARPVGGAAEMREAAARRVEEREKHIRAECGECNVTLELRVAARDIRAIPLPTPSPSTEPDAVPEGHERIWYIMNPEGGYASEAYARSAARRRPGYIVVYADIPPQPTVRGAVVGGA